MSRVSNRRRNPSALARMTTRIIRSIRRPTDNVDEAVPVPQQTPKPRTGKRVAGQSARLTRGNRRRENPVLVVLLWILPMAAALAAFATPFLGARAYEYLMSTGHFMVRDVIVTGVEQLERPAVLELAGIRPGTHVLASDLDAMARRISSHPWIAHAQVDRELPDRLIVTIDEHRPVAYVALGRLWLVNASGEPFSEATRGRTLPLPIISGIEPGIFASEATEGARAMARADIRAAVNLTRLYGIMGLDNRWPIGEMRVEPGGRMTIVVSNLGTEAVLGTGPYRQKLYRLEWVLEKLHKDDKSADYVLLDGKGPMSGMRDDGKVVVASDLARTAAEVAEEAQRRAHLARERAESNLPPSSDGEELERDMPYPVSQRVRPAVLPVFLDKSEELEGVVLSDPGEGDE